MTKKIKVTLVKSPIGYNKVQRATAVALGLGKLHTSKIHNATPDILGKIHGIAHLVKVEEVSE